MALNHQKMTVALATAAALCGAGLLLMYWTGLRLAWFDQDGWPVGLGRAVDALSPAGPALNRHIVWGRIMTAAATAGIVFLISIRPYRSAPGTRIFRWISVLGVVGLLVTGLGVWYGWPADAIAVTRKLHHYLAVGMVVLLAPMIVRLISGWRASEIDPGRLVPAITRALLAAGVVTLAFVLASPGVVEKGAGGRLVVAHRLGPLFIDGLAQAGEWAYADSQYLAVTGGANFPGSSSAVLIKSLQDKQYIYVMLRWADPEPSLNYRLEKQEHDWAPLISPNSRHGESVYAEDQVALWWSRERDGSCQASCHLGGQAGRSGTHLPRDTADLWLWKAQRTNPVSTADDWVIRSGDSLPVRPDPSAAGGYLPNFNAEWNQPLLLPGAADQRFFLDLQRADLLPYFAESDTFEPGATIANVLVTRFVGDRGDIRARGRWAEGFWTVEMARLRVTGSPFDLPLRDGAWLSLGLFNNAERHHAVNFRPIYMRFD